MQYLLEIKFVVFLSAGHLDWDQPTEKLVVAAGVRAELIEEYSTNWNI